MLNKQDLSLNELMVLSSEMRSAEKSTAIAYFMLLGGHLGLHRFYLKKKGSGAIQLILFIVATFFYVFSAVSSALESDVLTIISMLLFVLPAIALFIWVIVDLFLLQGMIRQYNAVIEQEILQEIVRHRHMEQLMGRGKPLEG
ncbi:NINE protein [Paenibacillus mendelii]|uniref:NINE protein n=1 Tax=Paenibacillus mendelii TaxID=206163 RepID=A0ABV6JN64_9BACL|nr:TM2 domain-containing protein [Paenibacillus mendelii]MCQ6559196.1 TM2 domain-containing protein [Paenibacillus mendelii]